MCVPVWWRDENLPFTAVENRSGHIKEVILDGTGQVTMKKP